MNPKTKKMSKESKQNTRIVEALRSTLKAVDRPLQSFYFHKELTSRNHKFTIERLRYYLYYYSRNGVIVKHKIPGVPAFYCLPEWFDNHGFLNKEIPIKNLTNGSNISA